MDAKKLPEIKNVTKDGIVLCLLKRIDDKVLVANFTDDGHPQGFEVHIVKIQKAGTMTVNGKSVEFEEAEKYRSRNDFGRYSFAYPTLDDVYVSEPSFCEHDCEIKEKYENIKKNGILGKKVIEYDNDRRRA